MFGALLFALATPAAAMPDFSWIGGDWVHCKGNRIVEERWLGPANGIFVGANLTRGGKSVSHEFFRIAPDKAGRWAYHAQPGGNPAVLFWLKEAGEGRAVFENQEHDFPQRVIYWREGKNLKARVEGTINGKLGSEEWTFAPVDIKRPLCG